MDFPWLLWACPLATFLGKKGKLNQKKFLQCSCSISCLITVYTGNLKTSNVATALAPVVQTLDSITSMHYVLDKSLSS